MTNSNISTEAYDLSEKAVVGGSWELPKSYIDNYESPEAPYWDFPYPEFTAYIKSVKETDDPNILLVEYYVYRLDKTHCSGYYQYWDNGKAMVNTSTHRRWNVA